MELNVVLIICAIFVLFLIVFILYRFNNASKKEFYPESKLIHRIVKYKHGMKNGLERVFYRTGELNKRKIWKNDKLEGLCETYYKSGEICIRCYYKNGLLDGRWMAYDLNGNVIEFVEYNGGLKVG